MHTDIHACDAHVASLHAPAIQLAHTRITSLLRELLLLICVHCVFLLHDLTHTHTQYNEAHCIVVNKTNAFFVDHQTSQLFHTSKQRSFPEFHPALALLVVYARKNKLMESMASVAINALKLASGVNHAA